MSSSSGKSEILLESVSSLTELRLLDSQRRMVAHGFGRIKTELDPGLYHMEVGAGASQKREIISVEAGEPYIDLAIEAPFPSAVPLFGTSTRHDVHAQQAAALSREPHRAFGHGGRLMIFVRNLGEELGEPIHLEALELHGGDGTLLAALGSDCKGEPEQGWAGLCADVEPGGYCLRTRRPRRRRSGDETVDQAVWVSPGWTTLVFIPNRGGRQAPMSDRASIHMVRTNVGFKPGQDQAETIHLAVEITLAGLQRGLTRMPREHLSLFLHEKLGNPMLGFLGAHGLLLEKEPDWHLFDVVLGNLSRVVPDHPDGLALRAIGNARRGEPAGQNWQVQFPPMLYLSYRGLIECDATDPGLIPDGSLADLAAARLYAQGPWSTWIPPRPEQMEVSRGLESLPFGDPFENVSLKQIARRIEESATNPPLFRGDPFAIDAPVAPPDFSEDPETARVASCLRGLSRQVSRKIDPEVLDSLSVEDLSARVGLPVSAVRRALRALLRSR
jgi:hypothetical protein